VGVLGFGYSVVGVLSPCKYI